MTHIVALNGQWEGLRALPRTQRTPDHRKRLEDGLEQIAGLYDAMSARAAMLASGMARLDGLAAGIIDQLDAIDAPTADLEAEHDGREPDEDFEPSLGGIRCGILSFDNDDREDAPEDRGEPSLTDLTTGPANQCGGRWIGGVDWQELEDSSDDEASLCGVTFGAGFGNNDGEATAAFDVDQTKAATITDAPPPYVAPRPTKPLLTVIGPVIPVYGPDGWQMSVYRDGQWVSR